MKKESLRESFIREASRLGDFRLLSKTDLANGYVQAQDNGNEDLRSAYFAALVDRYWNKISSWKCDQRLVGLKFQESDFVDWLVDAITYAVEHRGWLDSTKDVYGDPNGPDKIINMCCASEVLIVLQHHNKDKRKANIYTFDIDASVDENGDCALDYAGATEGDCKLDGAKSLILNYLKKGRVIEALVLDGIAYQDAYKEVKTEHQMTVYETNEEGEEESYKETVTGTKTLFDERKLVAHLANINQSFMHEYFANEYEVTSEETEDIFSKLKTLNNAKLYQMIRKTLLQAKNDPTTLACLLS